MFFFKPIQLYLDSVQKNVPIQCKIIWYLKSKRRGQKKLVARGKLVSIPITEPIIKPDSLDRTAGQ